MGKTMKFALGLAAASIVLASCGGGNSSSGRTRNGVLEGATSNCITASSYAKNPAELEIRFCSQVASATVWSGDPSPGTVIVPEGRTWATTGLDLTNVTSVRVQSLGADGKVLFDETIDLTFDDLSRKSCADGGLCNVTDEGPRGGRVFYVADSPQSWGMYLAMLPQLGDKQLFGCDNVEITDTKNGIGNSSENTKKIIAACGTSSPIMETLKPQISAGGASLPTRDEVVLAAKNLQGIEGFDLRATAENGYSRPAVSDMPVAGVDGVSENEVNRRARTVDFFAYPNWSHMEVMRTMSELAIWPVYAFSISKPAILEASVRPTSTDSSSTETPTTIGEITSPVCSVAQEDIIDNAGGDYTAGDLPKTFECADVHGANFTGRDLQRLSFEVANVSRANFTNANLEGANFTNANCRNANFTGANLTGALFSGDLCPDPRLAESAPTMKTPINLAAERKSGSDGKPTVIFSWAYDRPADEVKDFYVQVNVSAPGPTSETQGIFQPGFGSGEGSTSLGLEGTPYDVSMFKEDLAYEITFIERWVNNPRRMSEPSAPLLLVLNPSTPPSPPPVVREDVTKCSADNVVVTLTPSEGSRITTTDDVTLTLQSPCLTLEASDLKVALEFTNTNEHLYQCSKQKEPEPRSCLTLDGSDKVSFTTKLPAGEYQAVASLNAVFDYGKDDAGTYSFVIPKRLTVEQASSGVDNLCNASKLVVKDGFVTHTCSSKWRVGLDVLRDGDNPRRIWDRRKSDYEEQLSLEEIGPGFNVIAMKIERATGHKSYVSLMPFCYSKCETKKSAGPLKVILGDTSVSAEMLKANASDCQGRIEDSWQIWLLNTTGASPWPSTVTQEFSTSETDGPISVDLTSFDQPARKQMSSFAMSTRLCWIDGVSNALATAFIDFQPLDPGSNVTGPSGEQADGQSPPPNTAADGSNNPDVTKVSVDQVLDPRSTVPVLVSNETTKILITPESIIGPISVGDLASVELQKLDGTWEYINFAGGTFIPMSGDVTRSTFRVTYKDRIESQVFTKTFVREDQAAMVSVVNVVENGKVTVTDANIPATVSGNAGGESSPSLWLIALLAALLLAFGTLVIRRVVIRKRDMGMPS